MKKIFASILVVVLMAMTFVGCARTPSKETQDKPADVPEFIRISEYSEGGISLVYDTKTMVVYYYHLGMNGWLCPYINDNGKYCQYQEDSGEIIEIPAFED